MTSRRGTHKNHEFIAALKRLIEHHSSIRKGTCPSEMDTQHASVIVAYILHEVGLQDPMAQRTLYRPHWQDNLIRQWSIKPHATRDTLGCLDAWEWSNHFQTRIEEAFAYKEHKFKIYEGASNNIAFMTASADSIIRDVNARKANIPPIFRETKVQYDFGRSYSITLSYPNCVDFQLYRREDVACSTCLHISRTVREESWFILNITTPIAAAAPVLPVYTIEMVIQQSTAQEALKDFRCQCGVKGHCTKSSVVIGFPEILQLQIARFGMVYRPVVAMDMKVTIEPEAIRRDERINTRRLMTTVVDVGAACGGRARDHCYEVFAMALHSGTVGTLLVW